MIWPPLRVRGFADQIHGTVEIGVRIHTAMCLYECDLELRLIHAG